MKTKVNILWSLEIVGGLLLILGIVLGFVGGEIVNIPFTNREFAPFALGFCGVILLISAGTGIQYEKTKTKEQEIEEKDERMNAIDQDAKSKAFDMMAILLPFVLLVLPLFGYLNQVAFFVLSGLYILSFGFYKFHLEKNKKEK